MLHYVSNDSDVESTPATHDRSLVMSRGKRFESARRLSISGLDKPKTRV
jgi:hypothetical protein